MITCDYCVKERVAVMEKVTINIPIELVEEDLQDIMLKVAADDINLSILLSGFISDLIGSRYTSNGSDEVTKANDYYDRCWYYFSGENTFLRYLYERGINYLTEDIELIEECYNDWSNQYNGKPPQTKETAFNAMNKLRNEYYSVI